MIYPFLHLFMHGSLCHLEPFDHQFGIISMQSIHSSALNRATSGLWESLLCLAQKPPASACVYITHLLTSLLTLLHRIGIFQHWVNVTKIAKDLQIVLYGILQFCVFSRMFCHPKIRSVPLTCFQIKAEITALLCILNKNSENRRNLGLAISKYPSGE